MVEKEVSFFFKKLDNTEKRCTFVLSVREIGATLKTHKTMQTDVFQIYAITTENEAGQYGRAIVIEVPQTGLMLDYSKGTIFNSGISSKLLMGNAQLQERAIVYKYVREEFGVDFDTYVDSFKTQLEEWHKLLPTQPSNEEGISDAQA